MKFIVMFFFLFIFISCESSQPNKFEADINQDDFVEQDEEVQTDDSVQTDEVLEYNLIKDDDFFKDDVVGDEEVQTDDIINDDEIDDIINDDEIDDEEVQTDDDIIDDEHLFEMDNPYILYDAPEYYKITEYLGGNAFNSKDIELKDNPIRAMEYGNRAVPLLWKHPKTKNYFTKSDYKMGKSPFYYHNNDSVLPTWGKYDNNYGFSTNTWFYGFLNGIGNSLFITPNPFNQKIKYPLQLRRSPTSQQTIHGGSLFPNERSGNTREEFEEFCNNMPEKAVLLNYDMGILTNFKGEIKYMFNISENRNEYGCEVNVLRIENRTSSHVTQMDSKIYFSGLVFMAQYQVYQTFNKYYLGIDSKCKIMFRRNNETGYEVSEEDFKKVKIYFNEDLLHFTNFRFKVFYKTGSLKIDYDSGYNDNYVDLIGDLESEKDYDCAGVGGIKYLYEDFEK